MGNCCATQLIYADGCFNDFIKTSNIASCGLSYALISIIGAQSSGKSTLFNLLFSTHFMEMDAFKGRSKTTKGVWIDKCAGVKSCIYAMDVEGTDGRERGEDDTTFEKQTALFALLVSDIVLINMWCTDVGREQAANRPLLKRVFEVACSHEFASVFTRKTTLHFVLRDLSKLSTQTPLEKLEPILREDIQKIWDSVPKTQAHVHTPLSEFFNVEVTALSNYDFEINKFNEEVAQLRQHLDDSIASGGLAGDRRAVVPASAFSISAKEIWKLIRENKALNLPAHKVMVATVRCDNIADEKLSQLYSDKGWLELKEAVRLGPVQGFGKKLSSIIDTYLSLYDKETIFLDEDVRNAKRKQLESNVLNIVYPAYTTMTEHLSSKALKDFKTELVGSLNHGKEFVSSAILATASIMLEFDKGCADASVRQANWGASKVRDKLCCDINSLATSVHNAKLLELKAEHEEIKKLGDIVKMAARMAALMASLALFGVPDIHSLEHICHLISSTVIPGISGLFGA